MIFKALISLLISPILFVGQIIDALRPVEYKAPIEKIEIAQEIVATTTPQTKELATSTATSTKENISTKKTVQKIPKKEDNAQPTPVQNVIFYNDKADFEKINTDARKSIVNILCTTKYGDLSPISGTGVIVNKDGVILTNAHIAQYLLLKDFTEKDYLKCVARTGSPAYPRYTLGLVYISPTWVLENKTLLKEQNPKGTGENDFGFLKITGNIDGSPIQNNFNYTEVNLREYIQKGEPVLLASYPAGFLGGISILQDLSLTSSITNIQDVFTFKDGSIDIISVGGTVVSQKGSSGGMVVDSFSSLIGIISTSSDGDTTSSRGLNAITTSYISRALQKELGINLREFLESNSDEIAKTFEKNNRPNLTKLISDELLKR